MDHIIKTRHIGLLRCKLHHPCGERGLLRRYNNIRTSSLCGRADTASIQADQVSSGNTDQVATGTDAAGPSRPSESDVALNFAVSLISLQACVRAGSPLPREVVRSVLNNIAKELVRLPRASDAAHQYKMRLLSYSRKPSKQSKSITIALGTRLN